MSILKYIKYYLGFPSIIKTEGRYFVVKGMLMKYLLDPQSPHLWWYRINYPKSFSFSSYNEALDTLKSLKVEVL